MPPRGRPVRAPLRAGLPHGCQEYRGGSQEAISAIRSKAELARRLSGETIDPGAKARLLEIASLLDADADKLGIGVSGPARAEYSGD